LYFYLAPPEISAFFSDVEAYIKARPMPSTAVWKAVVAAGDFRRVRVAVGESMFYLKEIQKAELSRWASAEGNYDKCWLLVRFGVPVCFFSERGVHHKLHLIEEAEVAKEEAEVAKAAEAKRVKEEADAAAVAAAKAQVAEVLALKNVTVPDKANASKYELQAQMMYCGMDLMTAGPGASKFYEAELAHLREEHPELFQWEELRRLEKELTLEAGHMSNPSKELVAVRERIKEIDAEIRAGQWKPPLGHPLFQ